MWQDIIEPEKFQYWDWTYSNTGHLVFVSILAMSIILVSKSNVMHKELRKRLRITLSIIISVVVLSLLFTRTADYKLVTGCLQSKCYKILDGVVESVDSNDKFYFVTFEGKKYSFNVVSNFCAREELQMIKVGQRVKLGYVDGLSSRSVIVLEIYSENV